MTNDIAIEHRPVQTYVGMRTVMPMDQFDRQIPEMTARVAEWLAAHSLRPAGNAFLRYHTIDMPHRMDVELGIPAEGASDADGPLRNAVMPAGRYAVLTYRGVKNGVAANKRLLDWIAE
ncbi:GyrI-like domain-containing protein [Pseudorhodoferax sp.]|uniref:GyrI-like domain-containing protein n=1 Tax=Pseudorhodoferax sp. TaxID=1993553 RepID=UPI002DD63FB7|nr:GyrI-like domain-containing protein [Pseudorhodoferax sp.]